MSSTMRLETAGSAFGHGLFSRAFPTFSRWWSRLGWPILGKQLRIEFRRDRFLWLHTLCLAAQALSLLIVIGNGVDDPSIAPGRIGQDIFNRFVLLQVVVVLVVFPAFSATAFSDERRAHSLDLLLLTSMGPAEIVRGKFLAAAFYCLFYVGATLPLLAISFLFGGISVGEVLVAYAALVGVTLLVTALGLCVSSYSASSVRATFSIYGLVVIAGFLVLRPVAGYFLGESNATAGTIVSAFESTWDATGGSALHWTLLGTHAAFAFVALLLLAVNGIRLPGEKESAGLRLLALVYIPFIAIVNLLASNITGGTAAERAAMIENLVEWVAIALLLACLVFSTEDLHIARRKLKRSGRLRVFSRLLAPGAISGFAFSVALAVLTATALLFLARASIGGGAERLPPAMEQALITIPLYVAFASAVGFTLAAAGFPPRHARMTLVFLLIITWVLPAIFLVSDAPDRIYHGYWLSPPVLWMSLDHLDSPPRVGEVTFRLGDVHIIYIAQIAFAVLALGAIFAGTVIVRGTRRQKG